MYVAGRAEDDVKKEELGGFLFSLGTYKVNRADSSVTGSVWGLARRKAIYRPGLGCTLVRDINEGELRKQHFILPTAYSNNADSIPWPNGDLISDTFPKELDRQLLNKAVDAAFAEPDKEYQRRTRAVLVLYDGQLVAEKYATGFDKNSRMHGWSMAKSFAAALIGILIKENKLSLDQPAPVAAWKNDGRQNITIRNLLQQMSGLDYREIYTGYSEVTNMLFNKGDMAGYTMRRPSKYPPDSVFNYSSGNSNILSQIIRNTVGDNDYYRFPSDALFNRIGMRSAILEPDASGTFVMSSYIFATARDYARFGLLYYNNGKWDGQQLLPEGWVDASRTPAPTNPYHNYGFQFWTKGLDHHPPHKPNFPDVPSDLYYADGYANQDIYIIPSKKLVVVRLGLTLDSSFDENEFLKGILKAIRE
jgi:CubicO group peptidase (beta-lactamase class C family)